jgi:hypothetical protein
MTKTFEELEAKVERLADRLVDLVQMVDRQLEIKKDHDIRISNLEKQWNDLAQAVATRASQELEARVQKLEIGLARAEGTVGVHAHRWIGFNERVTELEIAMKSKADIIAPAMLSSLDEVKKDLDKHRQIHNTLVLRIERLETKHQRLNATDDLEIEAMLATAGEQANAVASGVGVALVDAPVRERVTALETLLLGDQAARKQHEDGKRRNTYPNIPDPAPGVLEQLQCGQQAIGKLVNDLQANIKERFAMTTKLQRFLDHLLENDELAPQLLTRGKLDIALETLSGALRREVDRRLDAIEKATEPATELARAFRSRAFSVMKQHRDSIMNMVRADQMGAYEVAELWVFELEKIWNREQARILEEEAERARPSRIALLRSLITGQPPSNGAHR